MINLFASAQQIALQATAHQSSVEAIAELDTEISLIKHKEHLTFTDKINIDKLEAAASLINEAVFCNFNVASL